MNILILGGFRPIHKIISKMGHKLTLVIDKALAKPQDISELYEEIFVIKSVDGCAEFVIKMFESGSFKGFDLILGFNEKWQICAAQLSDHLGLPCNLNAKAAASSLNKYETRTLLDENDISNIRYEMLVIDNATAQLYGFPKPMIVKPVNGEGSKEVFKISSNNEVDQVLHHIGGEFEYILEQWVKGPEFSVECISESGFHRVLAITEKFKLENHVELGHRLPAPISESDRLSIEKYVYSVLDALGIVNGPSHTEIIMSSNGPILVETHTRLGGDNIYELIKLASGLDVLEMVANSALGNSIEISSLNVEYSGYAAIWFYAPKIPAKLRVNDIINTNPPSELKKYFEVYKERGSDVKPIEHSFDRLASVMSVNKCAETVLSEVKNYCNNIEYTYSLEGTNNG